MEKKKMKIEELKVQSFVTTNPADFAKVKGGDLSELLGPGTCPPTMGCSVYTVQCCTAEGGGDGGPERTTPTGGCGPTHFCYTYYCSGRIDFYAGCV
jgi:hypothetical protein